MPLSDLTLLVAAGRGINPDDKPFMRILSRRVGACLRNLRKKELVTMTRPPEALDFGRLRASRCFPVLPALAALWFALGASLLLVQIVFSFRALEACGLCAP